MARRGTLRFAAAVLFTFAPAIAPSAQGGAKLYFDASAAGSAQLQ